MTPRRAAHGLLLLVGLFVAVFGVVRTAHPAISCRGVPMGPGDVCHKNDFGQLGSASVQTYEQRVHAARLSQPVVAMMGLGMAGFGAVLLSQDVRRGRRSPAAPQAGAGH